MTIHTGQRHDAELRFAFLTCAFLPFPLSFLKFILPWSCHCALCRPGISSRAQSPPLSRVGNLSPPDQWGAAARGQIRAWPRPGWVSMASADVYKGFVFDLPGSWAAYSRWREGGRKRERAFYTAHSDRGYERTPKVTSRLRWLYPSSRRLET